MCFAFNKCMCVKNCEKMKCWIVNVTNQEMSNLHVSKQCIIYDAWIYICVCVHYACVTVLVYVTLFQFGFEFDLTGFVKWQKCYFFVFGLADLRHHHQIVTARCVYKISTPVHMRLGSHIDFRLQFYSPVVARSPWAFFLYYSNCLVYFSNAADLPFNFTLL